jgi:hypothetical protein
MVELFFGNANRGEAKNLPRTARQLMADKPASKMAGEPRLRQVNLERKSVSYSINSKGGVRNEKI